MTLTVVLSLFLAGLQPPAKPFALMVGDPAPPIRVSAFLKGEPVTAFQKGQVYVIDFWATWCGPCRESIPHLTELQKKYGDKVRIVGVSVWEPREKDVEPFVKEWGDRMGYTVASDRVEGITAADDEQRSREAVDKGLMSKSYMVDSGWAEIGIPCVFIINREGRIAWIGSGDGDTTQMDRTLDEVVSGQHDLRAAAVTYQKKMEIDVYARGERVKALEAQKAGDFAAAEKHWDNIIILGPDYEHFTSSKYFMLLHQKKAPDEAAAFLSRRAAKLDWVTIMNMTATLAYEGRDLEAEHLRAGIEACQLALSKKGQDHPWPLMTMAAMHYRLGENDKAVALVDRALLIAKDNDRKSFLETRERYAKGGGSLKDPPEDKT
ncbi:MAG: Redoxin domain protein [Candidatus Aminicenantes bacterium]|nr:Redoxin domain protein [Candidatus Aminicenantes bacterium]